MAFPPDCVDFFLNKKIIFFFKITLFWENIRIIPKDFQKLQRYTNTLTQGQNKVFGLFSDGTVFWKDSEPLIDYMKILHWYEIYTATVNALA